jgi:hypothetical protein
VASHPCARKNAQGWGTQHVSPISVLGPLISVPVSSKRRWRVNLRRRHMEKQ